MDDLVERLRKHARIVEIPCLSLEAADRIEKLEAALRIFIRCAYPVSTEISPRGYNWSEAYLDEALANARATITSSAR